MLDDHYPRIRALHQQALDNAEMEKLGKSAEPLMYMTYIVIAVLLAYAATNIVSEFIDHYRNLVAVNDATVACLNGHTINLGEASLRCEVQEYKKLVAGLSAGGQP